jgi:hypothetical protein
MCRLAKRQATTAERAGSSSASARASDASAVAKSFATVQSRDAPPAPGAAAAAARRVLTDGLLLKEVLGFVAGHGGGTLDPARAVGRQWRAAVER